MTHLLRVTAMLILFMTMLLPGARAQSCTAAIDPLNFGTTALNGTEVRSSTTMRISCNGIARRQVRVCVSLGQGSGGSLSGDPRLLRSGNNTVAYQLYRNGGNAIFGSWTWPYGGTGDQVTVNLGSNGAGSETLTIRGAILSGQTGIPAGTYISTFAGADAQITYGYVNATGGCNSFAGGIPAFASLPVTLVNQPLCTVSASPLDFGTVGLMNDALRASTNIAVTCPPGLPYTISLDGGRAQASDPLSRRMQGPGGSITYGLYRNNARTLPWGSRTNETQGGTGSGAAQSIPVYGMVPLQDMPGPGDYTDNVVITVTY